MVVLVKSKLHSLQYDQVRRPTSAHNVCKVAQTHYVTLCMSYNVSQLPYSLYGTTCTIQHISIYMQHV
jgi:hypothetical protein